VGLLAACLTACSAGSTAVQHASTSTATTRTVATSAVPTSSAPAPVSTTGAPATSTKPAPSRPATRSRSTTHRHATAAGPGRLPVRGSTKSADQVITVTATSTRNTVATLQAWQRVNGGWRKHGSGVTAHLGSDGLSTHPSESKSATPIGSFTLTRAFGHDADPGTALPYTRTTPDDWWISQPGELYNTRQRCASHCAFTRGDPNEHLYYETPFYDYAVVIDYNTANAPGGVHQGAGSAFFLHVTDGHPTAGCVSIPMDRLTSIMRWLRPADHPRILIGVA
jgi:L,D-peptidoglycan transpeptidase YkuD (ErfK/YbiS/YcfS/YnhG family)